MHSHDLWSPYTDVNVEWDVFVSRLSRARRQVLRRKQRRLGEMGTLRLDVQSGADHLDDLLVEVLRSRLRAGRVGRVQPSKQMRICAGFMEPSRGGPPRKVGFACSSCDLTIGLSPSSSLCPTTM